MSQRNTYKHLYLDKNKVNSEIRLTTLTTSMACPYIATSYHLLPCSTLVSDVAERASLSPSMNKTSLYFSSHHLFFSLSVFQYPVVSLMFSRTGERKRKKVSASSFLRPRRKRTSRSLGLCPISYFPFGSHKTNIPLCLFY